MLRSHGANLDGSPVALEAADADVINSTADTDSRSTIVITTPRQRYHFAALLYNQLEVIGAASVTSRARMSVQSHI